MKLVALADTVVGNHGFTATTATRSSLTTAI